MSTETSRIKSCGAWECQVERFAPNRKLFQWSASRCSGDGDFRRTWIAERIIRIDITVINVVIVGQFFAIETIIVTLQVFVLKWVFRFSLIDLILDLIVTAWIVSVRTSLITFSVKIKITFNRLLWRIITADHFSEFLGNQFDWPPTSLVFYKTFTFYAKCSLEHGLIGGTHEIVVYDFR